MSEKKAKESKKVALDQRVESKRVQEQKSTMKMLVRSTEVSAVRKGLVRASDVERARREIVASKAREKKKQ